MTSDPSPEELAEEEAFRRLYGDWRALDPAGTAAFMAGYARWDEPSRRYVLGPPLIPAQELHPPRTTFNPTFELAYWEYGLATAQRWRERLGLAREPAWDRVLMPIARQFDPEIVLVSAGFDAGKRSVLSSLVRDAACKTKF